MGAPVEVPKATVDKNDPPMRGKDEVGLSRQAARVEPVTKAQTMNHAAHS
jgi:hypothetical protein